MAHLENNSLFLFLTDKLTKRFNISKNKNRSNHADSAPDVFNVNGKNNTDANIKKTKTKQRKRRRSSYLSISVPAIQTDLQQIVSNNPRTVFLNLSSFYQFWRSIPSDILFDAIIILPNIYSEWILKPEKYNDIPQNISEILSDHVFLKLLQWKYEQCLLFCMLNTQKTILSWNISETKTNNIAPFWKYLSLKLCQLNDPLTYKTSNYKPLIFDHTFYKNPYLFYSKFGVLSNDIISELATMKTMSCKIMKEILFQANPSLNVVVSYSDIINSIKIVSANLDILSDVKISDLNKADQNKILSPDLDILLDAIMDTYDINDTMNKNKDLVSPKTCNSTDDWWFAEDYETYDGSK